MGRLPPGWESDYDGRRWFFTHKLTGHIQYQFPCDGDEFPDHIDISAPAPEERLQLQQHLRRLNCAKSPARLVSAPAKPTRPRMTPTNLHPFSCLWEGSDAASDCDGQTHLFRSEAFMFLGLATAADVRLADEEEDEAPNQGTTERACSCRLAHQDRDWQVGHDLSNLTTVADLKSHLATEDLQVVSGSSSSAQSPCSESKLVPASPSPNSAEESMSSFDPLGVVAEMPTDQMPMSNVELYPGLVEMGGQLGQSDHRDHSACRLARTGRDTAGKDTYRQTRPPPTHVSALHNRTGPNRCAEAATGPEDVERRLNTAREILIHEPEAEGSDRPGLERYPACLVAPTYEGWELNYIRTRKSFGPTITV